MMKRNLSTLSLLGAFALAASTAQGQVILQETFDALNLGQVSGQGGWQGTGNAENWDVTTGGLNSAGGYISGGTRSAQIGGGDRGDVNLFNTFADQTGTIYARITFQNPTPSGTSQFFMFGLTSDGSSDSNSLSGVYASNQIRARAYENGTTHTNTNLGRNTLGFASDDAFRAALFTFVIKAEKSDPTGNYDTVTVFVNPDLSFGSSENAGLGSVVAVRDTLTDTLSAFYFRTGGSSPANAETFIVDSIAVGATWADIAAIPEPSTYAAIVGGLFLGLVLYRRRVR